MNKVLDIICAGELLVDLIGTAVSESLADTPAFEKHLGGSPTNVAANLTMLGFEVRLVGAVGMDSFGKFILHKLKSNNIDTTSVAKISTSATSVVAVSKSQNTPDFIPFRGADGQIDPAQLEDDLLRQTKVFHTTAFALSAEPARSAILKAAKRASEFDAQLSIDINYSEIIWPDRSEAQSCIEQYCALNPFVKVSEDDMQRYFKQSLSHEAIFEYFHKTGVDLVCLTLGKNGVKLSQKNKDIIFVPAGKIEVLGDVTGAGDAFWSGFLSAYLNGLPVLDSLDLAQELAAIKLQSVGRIDSHSQKLKKFMKMN
ncbi:MAG: carbohydrate kinase [Leeuwenhoekiella sp.]